MADPALLQLEGAPATEPYRGVPLTTQNFFSGLVTQRSPFSSMDNRYSRKYLGGRPDQLFGGLNTELTNYNTLIRRYGSSFFAISSGSPVAVSETNVKAFYSFRQLINGNNSITVMMDCTSGVYSISNNVFTKIFTKTTVAQTFFQGVGNTLYFGDGSDLEAWNPSISNSVRNWGIIAPNPTGTASAFAGTGSDVAFGGTTWSNPTHVQGSGTSPFAATTVTAPISLGHGSTAQSDYLAGTNYGFSLGNVSITSVSASIPYTLSYVSGSNISATLNAVLFYNGSPIGSPVNFAAGAGSGTANVSFPITGISPSLVNSTSFGCYVYLNILNFNTGQTATYSATIQSIQISIGETGAPSATPTGTGSVTTVNGGWQYVYAYGNSASGHVSSPTLPSASTGNFSNKQYVAVPVVASTDSQVNQIILYRTKDGGPIFFQQGVYPNTSTTIQDSTPDSGLNTLVFWPSIPWVGNSPPPAGLVKYAYHLGRVWGVVGNAVYYSGGPDTLIGNGSEAFPPANFFLFPTQVNRLVPYSSGLLVFTTDDIWIIQGTSIATFYAVPFQQGVGLLSYNALDVEGTTIFLFSSDKQFLSVSSAGVNEVGYAIGDQLQANFDPSKVYVASIIAGTQEKAVYINDGSNNWYRCNWNQPPEGGPAWSPIANIPPGNPSTGIFWGGILALTSVETAPGLHQLLFGNTNINNNQITVSFRDLTKYTDECSATQISIPLPYPDAYFILGSLVLALPGQIAEVDSIVLETTAPVGFTVPALSILTDEISGTFESLPIHTNDPPDLSASVTVSSNRWYLSQGQNPARLRHMQIKVDYNQDMVRDELLTLSVFGRLIRQD